MRKMKNSHFLWIGNIPVEWNVRRLKNVAWLKGRIGWDGLKADEFVSTGPFLITGTDFNDGTINWETCAHITRERFEEDTLLHIHEGDLLITKDGTIGKVAIAKDCPSEVSLNSGVMLIRKLTDRAYGDKYLYYVLSSPVFWDWYNYNRKPNSTIKHLYQNEFYDFVIPYPSINEQQKIVSYLDIKCSQIDEAIRRNESIIKKLREYRQCIITEAVTKGLDPNAEMKDSGNQFIGLIPKHWIVVRLKHLLVEGSDGIKIGPYGSALKGKTQPEGPFKIYNQANVISGDFGLCRHFISSENYKALSSYTVKAGDVLFSMMGTIGKCRIMPDGQTLGIMDSHLLKARLDNKKLLPNLFCYIYDKDNNPSSFAQMLFETQGSIMNGLNSEIVKNLWLAYPPDLKEQQEITKYLDSKCSQIDEAIRRQESIIKKLKAYRQSIIYEAVTGKREVV